METSIISTDMVDARVAPKGSLEQLSQQEIEKLLDSGQGGLYPLFRRCALAVLNAGSQIDDASVIFEKFKDFDLRIVRQAWGVKLEIKNAPASAFVDGEMIRGIKEQLFAVLRDVVFISNEIIESGRFDLKSSASITNAVFHILRNAQVLEHQMRPVPAKFIGLVFLGDVNHSNFMADLKGHPQRIFGHPAPMWHRDDDKRRP